KRLTALFLRYAMRRYQQTLSNRTSCSRLSRRFLGMRSVSRNVALTQTPREPVHGESTRRFAAAIEIRDYFAAHVHHLALRIDAQAGPRVVDHGRRPRGVERRRGDLVCRLLLAKKSVPRLLVAIVV